jgi:hypothetical protein
MELVRMGRYSKPEPDYRSHATFSATLRARLMASAEDPNVAGFKSVVCYRTGLGVSTVPDTFVEAEALYDACWCFQSDTDVPLRLAHKPLNDFVVRTTLEVAAEHSKPGMDVSDFLLFDRSRRAQRCSTVFDVPLFSVVQFHTGLGDADITLTRASPAHLQPLIEANPRTTIVLLHTSYPYTREAGYLTAMYKNVYLDIGEAFPVVSGAGQEALMRQVLELSPMNKVMWSSEPFRVPVACEEMWRHTIFDGAFCALMNAGDGHWWPETYYLGSVQARRALSSVRTYVLLYFLNFAYIWGGNADQELA